MLHINKYPKSFIALSFGVSIISIIDLVIESTICKYKYKYSQSWNDYSTGNTNILSYNNIDY